MFSKSCIYGIQAVLYIAQHTAENKNIGLKEIAESEHIPSHFLSKILQILVKKKILTSTRGLHGGFLLKKDANELNLMEVIEAIDGMDIFDTCVIGIKECTSESSCPIHEQYKAFQEEFMRVFADKTVKNLVDGIIACKLKDIQN
jgi:Rrf2 family protein